MHVGNKVIYGLYKQSNHKPGRALRVSGGFEAPIFQNNRHMKVIRLSALYTGRLYPQEISLVVIYVRKYYVSGKFQ
jgi:hypothetical protein